MATGMAGLARPAPGEAPKALSASELLALARSCGADDCGLVSIDDESLASERPHIARAFPATRSGRSTLPC